MLANSQVLVGILMVPGKDGGDVEIIGFNFGRDVSAMSQICPGLKKEDNNVLGIRGIQ